MSPLRSSLLRFPALKTLGGVRQQRRWAQVYDVRFLATQPQAVDRYREKLQQKAAQEGHANIDDLKAAYADRIQTQRKHVISEKPSPQPSLPPAEQAKARASTTKTVKTLGDILDLEKVSALPERELTAIWRLRHASDPRTLCAVIPASTYRAMEDLARQSPRFVLPVPHEEQGAEMHFLQWTFDPSSKTTSVLFTQLLEFKNKGEFAQPHTTVTHHLDLADEKGLVLMQGHVMEGKGVQPDHARWLVMCLQKFYGGWENGELNGGERAEERRKLLEWFTRGDERFSVEKLMEEAERMG